MAAYKATHEERPARRREMVAMRKRGVPYSVIARKYGIRPGTARKIVLMACNICDNRGRIKDDYDKDLAATLGIDPTWRRRG